MWFPHRPDKGREKVACPDCWETLMFHVRDAVDAPSEKVHIQGGVVGEQSVQEKMQFHDCRAVGCFSPCCPQKTNLSPPRKQESSLSDCPLQPLFTTLSWPMLASIYPKWAKTSSFRSPVVRLSNRCQKGYGGMRALCPYSSILILSESQHHDNMLPTWTSGHFEKISGSPIVSYDFLIFSSGVIEVRKTQRSTIQTQLAACSPVSAQPYSQ